jgi:hypothetical protein
MKIKAPVTVFYNDAYVQPGTELDLEDDEARALIERFGEFDGDVTLDAKDLESLKTLNHYHAINSGAQRHG